MRAPVIGFAIAAAIVSIALSTFAAALPARTAEDQLPDQEELLWWLPADTETVVVSRGPFPLPSAPAEEDEKEDGDWFTKSASPTEVQLQFELLPLELFHSLDLSRSLQGTMIAVAMQGSRHFRDPLPGLDVMDFDGCSIVVFKQDLGQRGESMMRKLAKKASHAETVSGTQVLVFHQKAEHAEWDHFLAMPKPSVLLVANNLPYMREVLLRMSERKSPRALPSQLPEWSFLDPAARFWGLRHYDPGQAKADNTSPFSNEQVRFGQRDKQAIGVLFVVDPGDQRRATITSLSADASRYGPAAAMGSFVREPQAGVRYEVKVHSPKPGVLQQIYTLDRSSTLDYFVLTVQVALGRGMHF